MHSSHSLMWIGQEARRLHMAGLVSGKNWSLAQVCDHLALTMRATVAASPSQPPQWWTSLRKLQRAKRRLMRLGLLWWGRVPSGVPAPQFTVPVSSTDFETCVQSLEAAVIAFTLKAERADAAWPFHPMLGPMTGRQWRRFHGMHARHHFKHMRAIP